MIRLKNWSIFLEDNKYLAPELRSYRLQGNVYGHPKFNDGDPIYTSKIVKITDKGTHKEVITQSDSVYELYKEDVDPNCEKQFPDYYERLHLTILKEDNK